MQRNSELTGAVARESDSCMFVPTAVVTTVVGHIKIVVLDSDYNNNNNVIVIDVYEYCSCRKWLLGYTVIIIMLSRQWGLDIEHVRRGDNFVRINKIWSYIKMEVQC